LTGIFNTLKPAKNRLLSNIPSTPSTTARHAVQQHPNRSLQGDYWHRLSATYVLQHPIVPVTPSNTFPVARVKKIISQDDDINSCSNNAAFVITVATEMFLQHLVEQSHNVVKSERKPRRNIQYRDVGVYNPRTSCTWVIPLTRVQQTQLLA